MIVLDEINSATGTIIAQIIPENRRGAGIGYFSMSARSFLSFYSEEIQLVEAGGFFLLVDAIMILLSRPFTGKLMDVKGTNILKLAVSMIAIGCMF